MQYNLGLKLNLNNFHKKVETYKTEIKLLGVCFHNL